MKRIILGLLFLFTSTTVSAQVYSTAETNGTGKNSVSVQAYEMKYLGAWSNGGWAQVSHGLTDRVDAFALAGWTYYNGATQPWVGIGSNVNVGKLAGFDFSIYDYLTKPLARHDEASTLSLDTAVLVSRRIGPATGYIGGNVIIPIGHLDRATFTTPHTEHQLVAGAAVPVKAWTVYGEVDAGHLLSVGFGLSRSF
jgi:hypothetical protein